MEKRLKLGILGSGRGSNFIAIYNSIKEQKLNIEIAVVISDEKSKMLESAEKFGLHAVYINPKNYSSRVEFDLAMVSELKNHEIDLVILAGFMRILSDNFIKAFPHKILNIHPSLLPSFRGLHPQQQAIDAGVKYSGCTVHYVIPELDAGPIIAQEIVPVLEDDTEESLSARILKKEHCLYIEAIMKVGEGIAG